MGRYSKKRNIRKFWENPVVNLCYTLSVIALVAGLFLLCGFFGGADCLWAAIIALAAGVLLIFAGRSINKRKKESAATDGVSPLS